MRARLCSPTVCEKCVLGVSPSGAPFQDSGVFIRGFPRLGGFYAGGTPAENAAE